MQRVKSIWELSQENGNVIIDLDERTNHLTINQGENNIVIFGENTAEFINGIIDMKNALNQTPSIIDTLPPKPTHVPLPSRKGRYSIPVIKGLSKSTIDIWIKIIRYLQQNPETNCNDIVAAGIPGFPGNKNRMIKRGIIKTKYIPRPEGTHQGRGTMVYSVTSNGVKWANYKDRTNLPEGLREYIRRGKTIAPRKKHEYCQDENKILGALSNASQDRKALCVSLNIPRSTVQVRLNNLKSMGKVTSRQVGKKLMWSIK